MRNLSAGIVLFRPDAALASRAESHSARWHRAAPPDDAHPRIDNGRRPRRDLLRSAGFASQYRLLQRSLRAVARHWAREALALRRAAPRAGSVARRQDVRRGAKPARTARSGADS